MTSEFGARIRCRECKTKFRWREAKIVQPNREEEDLDLRPSAPACPKCGRIISIRQLKMPGEIAKKVENQAMLHHLRGDKVVAVIGVWGPKGGLATYGVYPFGTLGSEAGRHFDVELVKSGYPYDTWIRNALWGEAQERKGQPGERIMVHRDRRGVMWWSPVYDWITVNPYAEDLTDEHLGV